MRPIMTLPVLFHDRDLVVVAKPSGLLVHRTKMAEGDLFAMQVLRDQIGASVFPVHRLDRPTSGALIFALNKDTARKMSLEFEQRRVRKTYLAVVRGIPRETRWILDYPLKEELDAIADRRASADKEAQDAVTEFEVEDTVELPYPVDKYPSARYALIRAHPRTGRKHQIRRHLRHAGHPVIGDVNHGVGKHNRFFAERFGSRRLLLACTEIGFRHPSTGNELTVRAPLAADFAGTLRKLGWGRHVED
jgi:tRNA pseudouridine65 synthase